MSYDRLIDTYIGYINDVQEEKFDVRKDEYGYTLIIHVKESSAVRDFDTAQPQLKKKMFYYYVRAVYHALTLHSR